MFSKDLINNSCTFNNYVDFLRAGAECRARVLIPLGDLLHPAILTKHCGIQSCPDSMSWTLDVQWSWLLSAMSEISASEDCKSATS